uniref:Metalloendopeptidase n=1 Tax=Parastrongyloides trichosuri TaxID=131310 RepID=A0A0N4Z8K7_PARTI
AYFQKYTCLNFEDNSNYSIPNSTLAYLNESSCSSLVGKDIEDVDGDTDIYLTNACSNDFGVVAHETAHALGLSHEHQRFDRDNYIAINSSLIPDTYLESIMKKDKIDIYATFNISYDYGSIMHYPSKSSITNGEQFIYVKSISPLNKMLGQRFKLSFNDFKLLNHYYCVHKCDNFEQKCKNGGYLYWNNCTRCVCPKEYTGEDCSKPKNRSKNCTFNEYFADGNRTFFNSSGIGRCIHYINTTIGDRISVSLPFINTKNADICRTDIGLEVKYKNDKGTTGLCLCGNYKNIIVISESNEVMVTYTGLESTNHFNGYILRIRNYSSLTSGLYNEGEVSLESS